MLPVVFREIVYLCLLQIYIINCDTESSRVASNKTRLHRQKRIVYFTDYSGFALDVVMSLPLELPVGNTAFCSFVFSANFFLPSFDHANGLIPIPFAYIDEPGVNAGSKHRIELPPAYRQFKEKSVKKKKRKVEKSGSKMSGSVLNNYLMSRRRFYKMMETQMYRSGLNGSECLLKAICETSESSFAFHNGVIGSVVDVLFLPSASKDEKLPKKYYRAEANGKSRNCLAYAKACPKSIFDFISQII